MSLSHLLADGAVKLYGMNRRGPRLRGGYRLLQAAGKILPKLHHYPVSFEETGEFLADVDDPDTYWLLNAFLGDMDSSLRHLVDLASIALAPGDVVWDVGGSMGLFSSHMAHSRLQLKSVELFEPNPSPFRVAKALLGTHPRVHLHPFGLGKEVATAELYFGIGSGGASFKSRPKGTSHHVTCRIENGDQLLEAGVITGAPSLIKIDVEGFEAEVLQGLGKTISISKPVIFFEILFLSDEVVLGLVPENYRIAFIRDSDGKLIDGLARGRQAYAMDAIMAPRDSDFWNRVKSRFAV